MKKERIIHTDIKVWRIRLTALIDGLFRWVTINQDGIVSSSFCVKRNNCLTAYTADIIKKTQTTITPLISKAKELDYLIHEATSTIDTEYGLAARKGKRVANHRKELIIVLQEVNDKVLIANEELIKFRAVLESQTVEYLHSIKKFRRFREAGIDVARSAAQILNTNIDNPAYIEFAEHNNDIFKLIRKYEISDNSETEKEDVI